MSDTPRNEQQIGRFHVIRQVAQTGFSDVFEARDSAGRRICIKRLRADSMNKVALDLLALKHEASVLATIRHGHVMEVIEFGEDQGQPYLALEWIEGRPLSDWIKDKSLQQLDVVEIALQIADGLHAIHEKGILHRDLKPENIMVDKVNGAFSVKIADFGLAGKSSAGGKDFVGTLNYVSPEQAGLVDWPVEAQSDLYSMGVILYEGLTGTCPFLNADAAAILLAHLQQRPQAPSARVNGLHPALERLVMKLLEKEPSKRYRSARGLHADLQEIRNRLKASDFNAELALDTVVPAFERVRNVFVGRSAELNKLNDLFQKAQRGQFCVGLVSGVSGAGKSSLLREFENKSLIGGAKFAYGKCYEFSRALPYFVLSDALANLLQRLNVFPEASRTQVFGKVRENLGPLSSELVQLAPSFASVFPDAQPARYMGEGKQQEAIREVVTRLFKSLSQKGSPLVLILDDLQWADRALLDLLHRLANMGFECPALIVGTYRSEEVNEEHPLHKLISTPSAVNVNIGPLEPGDVSMLISRALAVDETGHEALDKFIQEKAKGNPLFSIELLKALIGDQILNVEGSAIRFDLEKANARKLPDSIVDIVLRRVSALSPAQRSVIGHAALLGTAFKFEQLEAGLGLDKEETHGVLVAMLKEQVLKMNRHQDYAFFHDKIHEACRSMVSKEERPGVHARYLQYLETLPASDDRTFSMASHAVHSAVPAKIVEYCAKAGRIALQKNANDDAYSYFRHADEALERAGDDEAAWLDIKFNLAECHSRGGRYEEARALFSAVRERAGQNRILQAQAQAKVAECFQREGKHEESKVEFYSALKALGFRIHQRHLWLPILLDRVGVLFFTLLRRFSRRSEKRKEMDLAVTGVLKRLWMVHAVNDSSKLTHISYRLLHVASKIGVSEELALAYQYLSFSIANSEVPNIPLGLKFARRAVDLARQVGAHEVVAGSLVRMAAYSTWQGRSNEALEYSEKAREMLTALGNLWDVGNAIIFSYFAHRTLGFLDKAMASANSLVKIAEETGSKGMLASGRSKVAEVLFLLNRFDEGDEQIRGVFELTEKNKLFFDYFQALKVYGYANLYKGRLDDAKVLFDKAVSILEKRGRSFLAAYRNDAYLGWCETRLRAQLAGVKADTDLALVKKYLKAASVTEAHYRDMGHVWRLSGWQAYLSGQQNSARKFFDRAGALFRTQERPIDAALVEADWALLTKEESKASAVQALKRSALIFGQHGAELHVERCTAVLKELGEASTSAQEQDDKKKVERLSSALLEISTAAVTSFEPMKQARALLDKTIHLLKAERAILFTPGAGDSLEFTMGRNVSGEDLSPSNGYSKTIVQRVASTREPIVVAGTAEGVLMGAHSVVEKNLLSMMAAPILLNEQLAGVLYIDNKLAHGIYREDDASFLMAIAKHIGVALEMSRAAKVEIEKNRLESDLKTQMALAAASKKVQVLVDNMQQALFSVDSQGLIVDPVSKYSSAVFGEDISNKPVLDVVYGQIPRDKDEYSKLNTALSVVFGESELQWDLARDDIPTRVERISGDQRQVFRIKTAPLWSQEGLLEKILFVVDDIGHLEELEKLAKEQSMRALALQEMADMDQQELAKFFKQAMNAIQDCRAKIGTLLDASAVNALMRPLHTLKGNAGTFRLAQIASVIHQSESKILEAAGGWQSGANNREPTVAAIETALTELHSALDGHRATAIRILHLEDRTGTAETTQDLHTALGRYTLMLQDLAHKLGKSIRLQVTGDNPTAGESFLEGLHECIVHLLRNSADHGLEAPDARRAAGKDPCGVIQVEIRRSNQSLEVVVKDDGRGIDGGRVAKIAVEKGLLSMDEADRLTADQKMRLIFRPGFSSKSEVSEISGRGVGMDAVMERIHQMGGTLDLKSEVGRGSEFRLIFPAGVALKSVS